MLDFSTVVAVLDYKLYYCTVFFSNLQYTVYMYAYFLKKKGGGLWFCYLKWFLMIIKAFFGENVLLFYLLDRLKIEFQL